MSATLVAVTADVSRADAVARVARVADRVRDMERDLRHARTRLAVVIAEAVDQYAAPIGRVASAAGCAAPTGRCTCTPTYRATAYDARTGRRVHKTFATRSAAKLWRQDAIVALRAGTLRAATPTTQTLAEALDALIAGMTDETILDRSGKSYKPATIRSYEQATRGYLKPRLGTRCLTDIHRRDVQALVDRLRADGLSAGTIHNKLDPLRVVYRRAIRDDVVIANPTDGLELPAIRGRRDRVASPDRARELIEAAPEQDRGFWSTAFYAGLRRGELRALRWRHVDFDAGVIRVEDGWDDVEGPIEVKTDAGRRAVPIVGALRRELAAHKLRTGRGDDDLVFGRTARLPFIPSTVRGRALTAWESAALDALTPHEARHTCASYLIAAGLNPKQVQTYIGHSDVRTTFNVYGHLLDGDAEQATAALDAYLDAGPGQSRDSRHPNTGGL